MSPAARMPSTVAAANGNSPASPTTSGTTPRDQRHLRRQVDAHDPVRCTRAAGASPGRSRPASTTTRSGVRLAPRDSRRERRAVVGERVVPRSSARAAKKAWSRPFPCPAMVTGPCRGARHVRSRCRPSTTSTATGSSRRFPLASNRRCSAWAASGARSEILGSAGRLRHGRRLCRGSDAQPDLRGSLLGLYRPQRGGDGLVRSDQDLL